jgi:hypothetical protein
MAEGKGAGQGRGAYTRAGVQRDQEARIAQNEADIAEIAAHLGLTLAPPLDETEGEAPAEGETTPTA